MSSRRFLFAGLLTAALVSGTGRADEVLDPSAVRNRLYPTAGRVELSARVGIGLFQPLTHSYTLTGSVAYDVTEWLALEVRATGALSGHTGFADRIARTELMLDPAGRVVNDLSDLWELKLAAAGGVRWTPIYGKLSLFDELPVRYQVYLWIGGGATRLHRQSLVDCRRVASRAAGTCASWFSEDRTAPTLSGAVGFRFFVGRAGAVSLELHNWAFRDVYRANIDRSVTESGQPSGTDVHGFTNLVLLDVGWTFFF